MTTYNWQQPDWPHFRYNLADLHEVLFTIAEKVGRASGEHLFDWHMMLMSGSFNPTLRIGCYRTDAEPMQIISGHHGKYRVHFEAPPASQVPNEMREFIRWFNHTAPGGKNEIKLPPVRAALAHLYFESIHPFDDGNGRIGRVIAEKALAQSFGHPVMLSLSHAIEMKKSDYYAALKKASRSNEVTDWLQYFSQLIINAQVATEEQINFILKKSLFFQKFEPLLNERQMKAVLRMIKAGIKGYEGGMSAKKYMAITHTSKATATRDLQHMLEMGALIQLGSGRSVRYDLNLSINS